MRRRLALTAALVGLILAGCGGDDAAETRLVQAFETVPGKDPLGSGYGWIDVAALRETGFPVGRQLEWARDALGPDARDLGRPAPAIRALGVDPARAEAVFSITSNYAFSMRFDGIDPVRLENAYRSAGATEGEEGGWTTFDIESESSIPLGTPLAPLGSLGTRAATRGDQIALARRDLWRSNLIGGERDAAIGAPLLAAGAECLGDAAAARFMLNNHTYLPGIGPDLLAFGVEAPGAGSARETFCAIDEDEDPIEAADEELRETFGPGGRDAILGVPTSELYSEASVERFESDGLPGVRVSLSGAPGTEPGQVFGAADSGSVMTWMGFQRPPKPEALK